MPKRPRIRSSGPLRSPRMWLFFVLMLLAVSLMGLSRAEHPIARDIRASLTDATEPLLSILGTPVEWGGQASDWIGGWYRSQQRALALQEDVDRLPALEAELAALKQENIRLEELLRLVERRRQVLLSARVIGISGGAFVRNVIVQGGASDGMAYGLPVTDDRGIVGRVIEVGRATSRVLLISDLNSRVPVFVGVDRIPAIAVGRNQDLLALDYLQEGSRAQTGDLVVTSGHGGVFPPGLAVGRVVRVGSSRTLLTPSASLDRLDVLQVRARLPDNDPVDTSILDAYDEAIH